MSGDLTKVAQITAIAWHQNRCYFEVLSALEDARKRHGEGADDFDLALQLALIEEHAKKVEEDRPKGKR